MEKYLTDVADVEITKEELESLGIIPKLNEDPYNGFGQNKNNSVCLMDFDYGDIPEYKRV